LLAPCMPEGPRGPHTTNWGGKHIWPLWAVRFVLSKGSGRRKKQTAQNPVKISLKKSATYNLKQTSTNPVVVEKLFVKSC
jgi:hypothetical protein